MKHWLWTTLLLCGYGFMKEIRPSEPFVTEYLIDYKNITVEEIVQIAFPVSTYTSLVAIIIVFLVTDLLRYRPIIILQGCMYVASWIFLTLGKDLTSLIIVEIFYGIACSADIAYYTYIYAKVDRKYYKKVTSYTSSSLLAGKFINGVLSQLLVSYSILNYHQLNYASLVGIGCASIISVFLLKAKSSLYFYKEEKDEITTFDERNSLTFSTRCANAYKDLWNDFKSAFSNVNVIKFSIWWALASAGQYQVINYIQALWENIRLNSNQETYNGAVSAIHTLSSSVLSLAVGYLSISWNIWGEGLLTVVSILQGVMLFVMSQTQSLTVAYITYGIFRTLHPVMITIASAEIAQGITEDSFGLVFGINTFVALFIQTIVTLLITDAKGFALGEREQYVAYGIYFFVLGIIFLCISIYKIVTYLYQQRQQDAMLKTTNNQSCTN